MNKPSPIVHDKVQNDVHNEVYNQEQREERKEALDKKKMYMTPGTVLLRRLIREYLRPQLPLLLSSFFFMAVAAAMTGALAVLMKPVIDEVFNAKE